MDLFADVEPEQVVVEQVQQVLQLPVELVVPMEIMVQQPVVPDHVQVEVQVQVAQAADQALQVMQVLVEPVAVLPELHSGVLERVVLLQEVQ